MLLPDLAEKIAAYRDGRISLDQFENWFRDHCRGMFGDPPEVLRACISIDAAFVELRDGGMSLQNFAYELVEAVRSFAPPATVMMVRNLSAPQASAARCTDMSGYPVPWRYVSRVPIPDEDGSSLQWGAPPTTAQSAPSVLRLAVAEA